MYNLNDKLHFGKYEGFTIEEIYCGQAYLTQQFVNDFLYIKLNNLQFNIDKYDKVPTQKEIISVQVKDFEILTDNKMKFLLTLQLNNFNIDTTNSRYDKILNEVFSNIVWELTLDDSSKETIDIWGSANMVIQDLNSKGKSYKLSADPSYIEWCINNLDTFFLDLEELIKLTSTSCHHFHGVGLFKHIGWYESVTTPIICLCHYESILYAKKFQLLPETTVENQRKFNDYHHPQHEVFDGSYNITNYSELDDQQYLDGYGGYHNNNMIDDAFEGDPDNYWNVD
jgi:hypothetical protein